MDSKVDVRKTVTKKSKLLLVSAVIFWRTEQQEKDGLGEIGIICNEGQLIIDSNSKPVKEVWNYKIRSLAGSLAIETNTKLNNMV